MNISLARAVVEQLYALGVSEYCVCAGSRNSPFVALLEQAQNLRRYSFFEERSAGFFALGRIKRLGKPVAVVTTSGTAAAELLPAAIEAHYSGLPLVVLTADRPPHYRNTGSPQTIEQVGLFSHYVSQTYDITGDVPEFLLERRPLHLNVCFDEPLLDEPLSPFVIETSVREKRAQPFSHINVPVMRRPLVIVGRLSEHNRKHVEKFLAELGAPVFAEAPSGLRASSALQTLLLRSGDQLLSTSQARACDGVIRIGSIPTVRFWRDLEKLALPVLSLSEEPFTGLTHGTFVWAPEMGDVISQLSGLRCEKEYTESVLTLDRTRAKALDVLLREEPLSEAGWFRRLSEKIPANALVYLGNSLPIREWDLAASYERPHRIDANRGANGIDGQLSSFFGVSSGDHENWGIFGDLTTLYDLSAPWILPQLELPHWRLVVINNFGGQIFSRLFQNPNFINSHSLDFKSWAQMWRLPYTCWADEMTDLQKSGVVEIQPNAQASARFWSAYGELWKSKL